MKMNNPEWAATVALIRAAEELDALQYKLWNALGHYVPNWSDAQSWAYRSMAKAQVELQEAALKSMPPGGTSNDYADIVAAIHSEGAAP